MKKDKQILKIEKNIFNELKDGYDNLEYMVKKYEGLEINFERLYNKIINYQYKEYGRKIRELEKIKKERSLKFEKNRKNWR